MENSATEKIKQAVGNAASELVQEGMIVGLGTGSTAKWFIEALGRRCAGGLKIRAIATSQRSTELAKSLGIPMLEEVAQIDLTVDGADEIDPEKRMIKGGGGALLREKIIATSSKEMLVIAHSTKLVGQLGAFGLPVEIVPFCHLATIKKLNDLGFFGKKREGFVTDNHNLIYDIKFQGLINNPEEVNKNIRSVVGVVETGFFFELAKRFLIGYADGTVKLVEDLRHAR